MRGSRGRELGAVDWLPLTDDELRAILGRGDPGGLGREPVVTWRSPRPMSAAALVRHGDAAVFVKRHHRSVRAPGQLAAEHALAGHLRERGLPVPAVHRLPDGESVLGRGEYWYEVHQVAAGIDLYREAATWSPYTSLGHAYEAGAALGRLHLAAADFRPAARPPGVLMNSCQVITAPDPLAAVRALARQRPALAAYLAGRRWEDHFGTLVSPLIADAGTGLTALPAQWGHGDWHPSNLTWTSAAPDARVAGIFDFGLANRTSAVHDLAVALERAVVSWPDLHQGGTAAADPTAAAVLLDGYQTVRPLTGAEAAALPLVLPVAHVEYALSEIDYFTSVAVSADDADLAYEYLIGHAWWFAQPPGAALLGFLAGHLGRTPARLPDQTPIVVPGGDIVTGQGQPGSDNRAATGEAAGGGMGTLAGKGALVTGGSRGIGRAIVRRLAADGASVVFSYLQDETAAKAVAAEVAAAGGRARPVLADQGSLDDLDRLTQEAGEFLDGLDIVVINAAGGLPSPIGQVTADDYDRFMAVNAKGPFFLIQHAGAALRDGGRIIAISTLNTRLHPPGGALYTGAKGALENFTKVAALEFGRRGITANIVSPGATDTDLLRAANPGATFDDEVARTALRRLGRPDDIAAVVAFLAGPDSGWISGQNLAADGGLLP